MSLIINTAPQNIDNSAAFNVTTSLVEDSSHVNLRIRADIYHEGIIKATVEKPKGIADFDFSNILKSLVPGLKLSRDSGATNQVGSLGSNLLTSWAVKSGTYTTFEYGNPNANIITSAICTVASELESNDIAVTIGKTYLFYSPDFINNNTQPYVYAYGSGFYQGGFLQNTNKGIIFMPTITGNIKIVIGLYTNQNFSGTFYCKEITTDRTAVGGLNASYLPVFTEVYENSSGVTTTGADTLSINHYNSHIFRYVSAKGDSSAFPSYVMHDQYSLFACKTIRNNICKFYTAVPYEYWLAFYTEYVDIDIKYSLNGGTYSTISISSAEGWGIVILNIGELMNLSSDHLLLYMNQGTTQISELIVFYIDSNNIDERVVLEFDGLLGGKEYLAFEGLKDEEYVTSRNYYTKAGKNRGLASVFGVARQKLETLFKDQVNAEYLKSLLISDNVKRLEASYAAPTEVTVITDGVTINRGRELFTNQIEIEYAD